MNTAWKPLIALSIITVCIVMVAKLSFIESKNPTIKNPKISNQPQFLVFIFQPSLKPNTEVVIDFNNKNLVFRSIYDDLPEPPPPPSYNQKVQENDISEERRIKPFLAELNQTDIDRFTDIIQSFSDKDYKRIEDNYVDGTSYNFLISYSDKNFRNGFIGDSKTEKQSQLISLILQILNAKNPYDENRTAL